MKELLDCVMDLGEQMIINGAEIYRVEDCINMIFKTRQVARVDTFIITSSMVVSVYDSNGECYTQTRRISKTNTNIEKIHRLNSLSREICEKNLSPESIRKKLSQISDTLYYPFLLKVFANAVIAASFTLFFGGNAVEAVISFLVGAIMQLTYHLLETVNINRLFEKFLSSFTVCMLAFLAVNFGAVSKADNIIIGNIMSMIPGIGFTNALRDLFRGDIFAGVHRTIESLLISVVIAAGYVITVIVFGGVTV